jgi:hypothetical protein
MAVEQSSQLAIAQTTDMTEDTTEDLTNMTETIEYTTEDLTNMTETIEYTLTFEGQLKHHITELPVSSLHGICCMREYQKLVHEYQTLICEY